MPKKRKRRNGEGSVFYRKDRKAWYAKIYDINGKRHQLKAEGCRSEKEALRFLKDKLAEEDARRNAAASGENMQLEYLLDIYVSSLKVHCSESHVTHTVRSIQLIINTLDLRLASDVTPLAMEAFISKRLDMRRENPFSSKENTRPLTPNTVNHDITAFKGFLNWAVEKQLLQVNPIATLKKLKVRKCDRYKIRGAFTPEEVGKLLTPENSPGGLDLIWATYLGTGLRRGELCRLRWDDLVLTGPRPTLRVRSDVSKNDAEDVLPLHQDLAKRLLQHKRRSQGKAGGLVFTTKVGTSIYNNLLRKFYGCLKRTGIERNGRDIQTLRKTYITDLLRQGVPVKTVQKLARHKTIEMTLNVYAEVFPEDLSDAVAKLSYLPKGA